MATQAERWSGGAGFVLATIGSAVGLGSVWKFPYEVGSNGGSVFVMFYLIGLVLIVVPLMLAELAIGRRGQSDARTSIAMVAQTHAAWPSWSAIGVWGTAIAVLILSFYSVIGGWALAYAVETAWLGLPGKQADLTQAGLAQARFDALLASVPRMAVYHTLFMVLTAVIVWRGIAGGIETACKILMPALVVLLVVLTVYAVIQGDVRATLHFLFALDPAKVTARSALEALGLGFFSIGVGMATMITYAAYAGRDINLRDAAIITVIGDTTISLLSGFAVFPIVFAHQLDPSSGPGLLFVTLPIAFATVPFGTVAAVAFFVLLLLAAIASAISMLEMPVALIRRSLGFSRPLATLVSASVCWIAGFASVLSFNLWASWFPLAAVPSLARSTVFDLLDHLTSNVMLPIGGLALALFVGWALPTRFLVEELRLGHVATAILRALLRYVAPAAIVATSLAPIVA
jgi:neurotransmitter:Na+ symporter, NSS family